MKKRNYFTGLFFLMLFGVVFATNVSTCQGLQDMNLSMSGTYVLTQNIDCSATLTWNGGEGFKPVGTTTSKFTGSFDGGGYTISNLYINRPTTDYVGIFGITSSTSTIQNVNVIDANVKGQVKTGILIGQAEGLVLNSTVDGNISGTSEVGGMIGYYYRLNTSSTPVTNLRSVMDYVSGTTKVGGLIGNIYSGINVDLNINDSSSQVGILNATGSYSGGLIGYAQHGYFRLYANNVSAKITGMINSTGTHVGGLAGYFVTRNGTIYDSNSDVNYIRVTGDVSHIGGLVGYLDGNVSRSYSIVNIIDVEKTGNTVQSFIGGLVGQLGLVTGGVYHGKSTDSWAQVGTINNSLGTYSGNFVGGLAGESYGGIINSYARGTNIISTKTGSGYVGGLAGRIRLTLKDSNAQFTDINAGSGSYVGGLVGEYIQTQNSGYDQAKNLFAQTGTISGGGYVGGLSGNFMGYSTTKSDFNNFSAITGNIYATGNYTGGLLGYTGNSYNGISTINHASAIISGKIQTTASYVGGLVGRNAYSASKIFDSNSDVNYITVTGDVSFIGGLVGTMEGQIERSSSIVGTIDVTKTANTQAAIGGLAGVANGLVNECWVQINNINNSLGTYSGSFVGGLVGDAAGGIENSYATGNSISSTKLGNGDIGGLAGRIKTRLSDSNSLFVTIDGGSGSYVGGLVGDYAQSSLSGYDVVDNVHSQTGTIIGGNYTAGLAGNFMGYSNPRTQFQNLNSSTTNIISSGQYVGGLIGYLGNSYTGDSNLSNSSAVVSGILQSAGSYTGGLVGRYVYAKSRIYDSNSDINYIYVNGNADSIAGLVGELDGNIIHCWSQANIGVNKTANGAVNIGGIVGKFGGTAGNGMLLESWADININSSIGTYSGTGIGGLVGRMGASNYSTISNSFSKGNYILATKVGGLQVGGIVGTTFYDTTTIDNSYSSITTISGGTNTKYGGITGENGTITDSFYSGTVSAGADYGAICGYSCPTITNTYYLSGNNVTLYGGGVVSTQGTDYFKSNSTNEPMLSWSFYNSQTNPSGEWYVWSEDYPHLTLSPVQTYYSSGIFVSKEINLSSPKKFNTINLDMLKPNDTNIQIQIRTAPTQGEINAAPWIGPDGTSDSNYSVDGEIINSIHDGNSWIQYKAILSTNDTSTTPVLYDVNIQTSAYAQAIYSKTGTTYSWVSFTPTIDSNGNTISWEYSLSNSPYLWISTNGTLSGNNNVWIKAIITGTSDSNNFSIEAVSINYSE